jgi:NAD(P)-dependent dehydrogenase (short-subunit alcohol dehydrogenase family)
MVGGLPRTHFNPSPRRRRIQFGVPKNCERCRPEEIATAVAILADDESSFMLGTEILLDARVAEL